MDCVCQTCGALLDEMFVCTDAERHNAALEQIEAFWKGKGYIKTAEGRYDPFTRHTIYRSPYHEFLATGEC